MGATGLVFDACSDGRGFGRIEICDGFYDRRGEVEMIARNDRWRWSIVNMDYSSQWFEVTAMYSRILRLCIDRAPDLRPFDLTGQLSE